MNIEPYKIFFERLLKPLKEYYNGSISVEGVRSSIKTINQFFFNSYEDIGVVEMGDLYVGPYFSEFHKIWHEKALEIISPSINEENCKLCSDILHNITIQFGDRPFKQEIDFKGLSKSDLATIRFLTANQDFRGSRDSEKFFDLFNKDPRIYDLKIIQNDPANFLSKTKLSDLSQNDKREKYAKSTATYLLDKNINAFGIADYFNQNAIEIKESILENVGMGYGKKKIDMFLRDMYEWSVWPNLEDLETIDVASDINTMKVALRTGILKTELSPLISSFLDIFCKQYGILDEWSAEAWRRVWELWKLRHPETAPFGPSFMDFLLYKIIGKDFCNERLIEYLGDGCNHKFFWYSARNKICRTCYNKYREVKIKFETIDNKICLECNNGHKYLVENNKSTTCIECLNIPIPSARAIYRFLPCTHAEGQIYIKTSKYVKDSNAPLHGTEVCPFHETCNPTSDNFVKYNPPKSISIRGRTGWESAFANIEDGGGGLMS